MKRDYISVRSIVICALFSALVTVMTMIISIPVPATKGFFNLGDTLIFITAALFGPAYGAVAGGLGSSLADLLLGYFIYAPWTFFIKGIEGFVAGLLISWVNLYIKNKEGIPFIIVFVVFQVISYTIAALWMVTGYFIAQNIMFDFRIALVEFPFNLAQGGISAGIAVIVITIIRLTFPEGLSFKPR